MREHVDGLDGVVHSIAFGNPETILGGKFLDGPWEDVAQAVQVSAYSLESLADGLPAADGRAASVVGLTFDATVAWPGVRLDGRGEGGAGVDDRYLARDLGPQGIRCNLVAAGPLKTLAAKAIPGFEKFEDDVADRAPLGWDHDRPGADRPGRRRAAERLLPGDHRRDRPRRRRLPRDGGCRLRGAGSVRA